MLRLSGTALVRSALGKSNVSSKWRCFCASADAAAAVAGEAAPAPAPEPVPKPAVSPQVQDIAG